ncbi:hypothetical protein BOTBODRAFT_176115 [Botryobasidium botryosum FD-172 SS1]|uniref:NAD(P)-binding protein n=1 Tax=Botryobasidium botryosum (strain FD-172 SS1) TaxID=930990 RepID=A0A067MAR8_BOTB1|nr:hypothetical protein BOTBODRAFT_176115 [Botryobasidium botryosum FD-172 SS1]
MGLAWSLLDQCYPPASRWTVDDVPDMTGIVAIVTGGNSGIGFETCRVLLEKNARVYMASRSKTKAEGAIVDLRRLTGKEALFLSLDLADLRSIKSSVEAFKSREKELHILFNNAGVMFPPLGQLTADGYDLQFGTNVLGHFYLTRLLLPILLYTARTSLEKKARIVTLSSIGAELHKCIEWDTLKDGAARRKKFNIELYCQSKFGNAVFAQELARKYGEDGIVATAINPGNINTDLLRYLPWFLSAPARYFLYTPPTGALTPLWAGTSPEGSEFNGKFLIPWARFGPPPHDSDDPVLGEKLWDWMEAQVKGL